MSFLNRLLGRKRQIKQIKSVADILGVSSPEELRTFFANFPEKSIAINTESLKNAQAMGERRGEAEALGELALAYARSGSLQKAIPFFEQHLEIARELGERQWEVSDLNNLGKANLELGNKGEALEFYKQGLTCANEINDVTWIALHSGNLASIYKEQGDYQQALPLAQKAAKIWRQIGASSNQQTLENIVAQINAAMQ